MAICPELTPFLINKNFLAYMSALRLYSLLPFRHITMSLPQKDFCLNMLCLLWVSNSIIFLSLGLSPKYFIAYLPSWQTIWLIRQIHLNTCHRFELSFIPKLIPLTTMHSHSILTLPPSYLHHTYNQIIAHPNNTLLILQVPHCKGLNHLVLFCLLLLLSHSENDYLLSTSITEIWCRYKLIAYVRLYVWFYTLKIACLLLACLLLMTTNGEESIRGCNRFLMMIASNCRLRRRSRSIRQMNIIKIWKLPYSARR